VIHVLRRLMGLYGRSTGGVTPWWRCRTKTEIQFRASTLSMWWDERESLETSLESLQRKLRGANAVVRAGEDYDRWDLEVRGGLFGGGRLLAAVEEHAPGKQFLHFRITPKYYAFALLLSAVSTVMSILAGFSGVWIPSGLWAVIACLLALRVHGDVSSV